jgi:hypothetical protein
MSDRVFTFEINRTTSAPATTLFRLETDGARWSECAKPLIVQSSWEQQGDPLPAGVGAVRKVGMWPMLMREKTIAYERDRRHDYQQIGPRLPARDYRAEMLLTPNLRAAPIFAGRLVHRGAARLRPGHAVLPA